MRLAACLLLSLAVTGVVQAQSKSEQDEWLERYRLIREVRLRAHLMEPRRRDEPLREANISDYEVREILHVVREHLPKVIVNIGPVVTGCSCEEGRACTEQVFIQANTTTGSVGLLLSRVARRWDISKTQMWWLRWSALQAKQYSMDFLEFREREWQLARDFPACLPEAASPANFPAKITAQPSAEPRK
jgi:hypothetical protein